MPVELPELTERVDRTLNRRVLETECVEITDAKKSVSLEELSMRMVRDEKNDTVHLYFQAERGRRFRVALTEVT